MSDNSPDQLVTELRRLRLEVAGMDEKPQLPYSLASLNIEVLRELQAIREEISDFKTTQENLNRLMLDEFKDIQRELVDLDAKVSRDLLSVKGSMNEESSPELFKNPFEKEIVGVWELVESPAGVEMAKYRKFSKNEGSLIECCSSSRDFLDNGVSISIVDCLIGNRLYTEDRRMRIKDSKLYIHRSDVLEAVYRKVSSNVFQFSTWFR